MTTVASAGEDKGDGERGGGYAGGHGRGGGGGDGYSNRQPSNGSLAESRGGMK